MASKKAVAKKASGRNVAESERNTVQLKVRLRPETAEAIRKLAKDLQCPISYAVEVMANITERAYLPESGSFAIEEVGEVLNALYGRDGE